jgi:hypothetical protein
MNKKWIYILYILLAIGTFIIFRSHLSTPYKIISLIATVVMQYIYTIKIVSEKYLRIYNWILSIIFSFLFVAFLFVSFQDYTAAAVILIGMMGAFILSITAAYVIGLWKVPKYNQFTISFKFFVAIILYCALAFNLIVFFAFIYNVSFPLDVNGIIDGNSNKPITNLGSEVFFSATVFYSTTFGSIEPHGLSRIFVIIECVVSAIVHIILLGFIIGSITSQKK